MPERAGDARISECGQRERRLDSSARQFRPEQQSENPLRTDRTSRMGVILYHSILPVCLLRSRASSQLMRVALSCGALSTRDLEGFLFLRLAARVAGQSSGGATKTLSDDHLR